MEIKFKNKKLEKCFISSKEANKTFGLKIARLYIMRVNIIKSAKSFDELYTISTLKFHPLTQDRAGEYSIRLDGYYRLIITNDGYGNIDIAKIEEVSKHYED